MLTVPNRSQTAPPWAVPQTIATLNPMFQQLVAPTTVQLQLPPASVPTSCDQTAFVNPPPSTTSSSQSPSPATAQPSQQQRIQDTLLQLSQAQQLQAQIQQHQVKLQQQLAELNTSAVARPVTGSGLAPTEQKKRKSPTQGQKDLKEAYERQVRSRQEAPPPPLVPPPRTAEDTAAGNMLLGFLCSLRQSYEDALRNGNDSSQPPARVSDESNATSESGEANQSSIEESDWNSDKKTDPSSSEDSDKEERSSTKRARVSAHDINRHGGAHFKNGGSNHQVVHGDNNRVGIQEKRGNGHSAN